MDFTRDTIYGRDIVEYLETLSEDDEDDIEEIKELTELIKEINNYSGDCCEDGVTLISRRHFVNYCIELLEDCCEIPKDLPHYIKIDWEETASNLEVDYASVDIRGREYLFR